jgi:ElaB/YqjD/DUF883 family membrane-anchored ribosome-binding protein
MNNYHTPADQVREELRRVAAQIESLEAQKRPLEQELSAVRSRIEALRSDRFIRLGLFGVRNSAKSSLLAAWYLFNADRARGILLKFKDDDSIGYLKDITEPILRTGSSRATPTGPARRIKFDLIVKGEEWHVETMDFTGGFLQLVSETEEKKMAQPSRDFLQQCEVILCCHYWRDRSQETLDAINRVLRKHPSQFLLAVTRLDEAGPLPDSKEEFESILRGLEATSLQFRNLVTHILDISRKSGTVYAIPISPLGKDFSDRANFPPGKTKLSEEDLTPFKIYIPLELAIERKKNREVDLASQRSELERRLSQVEQSLASAKTEQGKGKAALRERVCDRLAIMRHEVEAAGRNAEPAHMPLQEYVEQATQMHDAARSRGETEIATEVDGFLKWLALHHTRLARHELEGEFNHIVEKIEPYLDGSAMEWNSFPVGTWLVKLEQIQELANERGHTRLCKQCITYRNALQKRRDQTRKQRRFLLELGAVILVALLLGVPLFWLAWSVFTQSR